MEAYHGKLEIPQPKATSSEILQNSHLSISNQCNGKILIVFVTLVGTDGTSNLLN